MMGGMGFGMPMIGGIMMLGFWAVVIGACVLLVMTLGRGGQGTRTSSSFSSGSIASQPTQSPGDVLKTRFARGEITQEQYQEMRRTLES